MSIETQASVQTQEVSAFMGLQSYNEAQAGSFFGRDDEIERLTTLVKVNVLTIVFGASGTGKTSLLNAGVFPPLRTTYCLPFRIRLEFQDDSPGLVTQIKNVLKAEIDRYGFRVENYPGAETLWEYFHKEFLWKSITPILVFDQFEEIFTLAKKNPLFTADKLQNFWEELSNLIENQIPDSLTVLFSDHRDEVTYDYKRQPVKVIFAFREEFLPEFESIPFKIPSLKYSRFRLMPLSQRQAYDVVTKTWGNKIDKAQANKIISYLTNDDAAITIADIEPSLLSQVCFYLDKERIAQGNDKITSEFLDKYPKETILRSIYNEVLNESYDAIGRPIEEKGKVPVENPVKVFVEDKLITNEGYRTKYALTERDENLRPGIEVLKNKYFIRDDGKAVELTHDVLAPIIKADREKRRKKVALIEAYKKAGRIAAVIILLALILGGVLWWKGNNEKNIAEAKAAMAQMAEKNASDHKDSLINQIGGLLKDSARLARNNHNNGRNPRSPNSPVNPIPLADSGRVDSSGEQLTTLQDRIASLRNNIGLLNTQILQLNNTKLSLLSDNQSLKTDNSDLVKKTGALQSQIENANTLLKQWQINFDKLKLEYYNYKLLHPYTYPVSNPEIINGPGTPENSTTSIAEDLDSNSLKLNFNKKNNTNKPGTFNVYLIPDSSYNRAILKQAEYYDLRTNESKLKSEAKGIRRAKFSGGYYYFPNLPVGKYLIKVCTYYGNFRKYVKTKKGTQTLPIDTSPPIR